MGFQGLTCSLSNQTLAQNFDSKKKKSTKRNSYDGEALQKNASFVPMVSFFNYLFFVKMGIPGMKVWV